MSFNLQDRLEILNQLGLYAHYFDEGLAEEWVSLFTEDAVFSTSQHSGSNLTGTFSGRSELLPLVRLWAERRKSHGQNRHLLTSVAVLNQDEESAEVLALGLLVRTHPDGRTTFWSPVGTPER
jgi:3-phenylpropionate/cinnamic acid dioxygenase small subunit